MPTTFKTEHRSVIQLQNTPQARHFIGERFSHYYSVKTPHNLLCLVVYNRRNWAADDVPTHVVTNTRAAAKEKAAITLVTDLIATYGPPKMPSVHLDFELSGSIAELKTWLDNYVETTKATAIRVLDSSAFANRAALLKSRETARAAHRAVDETIQQLQREIAEITANSGQNLITAYSHGTRNIGASVWDMQYYDFPE